MTKKTEIHSRWHGDSIFFGMHYDQHAKSYDTELGAEASPEALIPMLRIMQPEFVQTDSKGHEGFTSWYTRAQHGTVSPGTVKDMLAAWCAAAQALNIPIHCHYSGLWDMTAGKKHPEWTAQNSAGEHHHIIFGAERPGAEVMATTGPYVDLLMIPQLLELIDRYDVDGFWIDGEIWAMNADYAPPVVAHFREETGAQHVPTEPQQPHWDEWMAFQRRTFYAYISRYCEAVHAHKDGVLVCSNWLNTLRNPGSPHPHTDWISGDNEYVWGLTRCRSEARFISTRGKHWDIMIWGFYKMGEIPDHETPWVFKSADMLKQEAAVVLALGGGVQIYEACDNALRKGRLVPWRQGVMGEVGEFVKARQPFCQHTHTIPQIAVLHSEHHFYHGSDIPFPHLERTFPIQSAVDMLLQNHYAVDVLDEWALLPQLDQFPIVVVPEQVRLSAGMVEAFQAYVHSGGHLLLVGAGLNGRFGAEFTGAEVDVTETSVTYYVQADERAAAVRCDAIDLLRPTTARTIAPLGRTPLLTDYLTPYPAATLHTVGAGQVAYIPFNLFTYGYRVGYATLRRYLRRVVAAFDLELGLYVSAPTAVDVALRQRGDHQFIHLMNRLSGLPNAPTQGGVDEIPPVGPITIRWQTPVSPLTVICEPGGTEVDWAYDGNEITITLERLHIHTILALGYTPGMNPTQKIASDE